MSLDHGRRIPLHVSVDCDPCPRVRNTLGTGAVAGNVQLRRDILVRASRSDYQHWLTHVGSASAFSQPIRLILEARWHSESGDQAERVTDDTPDQALYVACKNRRAAVCPACAETYRLVKSGLLGGKGVPESLTEHPCFFVTSTAPSFGPVHARTVGTNGRARPCRARRGNPVCDHGRPLACPLPVGNATTRATRLSGSRCAGTAHERQAVWNLHAGELWRRFTQMLNPKLGDLARDRGIRVRVSYAKVVEYQARGVVHFHALIRLDGYDSADPHQVLAPHPAITSELVASRIPPPRDNWLG